MTRTIIDVHSHVGHTITSNVGQTTDEWVTLMAESNVDQAVLSVAAGGQQDEGIVSTRRANDGIARAVATHAELFPVGLASVEVRHGAAAAAEVRRAFDELGLKGLAFHATFEGFTVGSAAFDAVLAATGDRRGLVLLHSTPNPQASPSAIAEVARRYPALTFIMGHPVFTDSQRIEAVAAVLGQDNVHLDVAFQDDPATTEFFVREVGAERVLFGSDAPFFAPTRVIESIERAQITEDDREAIFAGNARALFASL
jgi:predicted TIM-barrel fold metal-dependent hydrolase